MSTRHAATASAAADSAPGAELRRRAAHLPRVALAHLPTPLEEMPRLAAHLGGPRIFIKRDEAASIAELANQAAALLDLPPSLTAEQVRVDGGHVGPGYGQASPEGMAALALVARLEGILLDPVYTAKAMAALIADVRAGRYAPDQAVVFVHTGGTPALFAYRDDIARLVPRVTHAPPVTVA